jgi:hypothetical protein
MVIGVGCYLRRENTGLLFLTARVVIAIRRLWLAKEKGVGIPFLDVVEESIECYALIAKPTSRADARIGGMP